MRYLGHVTGNQPITDQYFIQECNEWLEFTESCLINDCEELKSRKQLKCGDFNFEGNHCSMDCWRSLEWWEGEYGSCHCHKSYEGADISSCICRFIQINLGC